MSWRYAGGDRAVSDCSRIRVYERENKRLLDHPLHASLFPLALTFLTEQGKLEQHCEFGHREPTLATRESMFVLMAEPRPPSSVYDRLALHVDARSFEVRRVQIMDAHGNRYRFDFAGSEVNLRVPPREFDSEVPPGTATIRV